MVQNNVGVLRETHMKREQGARSHAHAAMYALLHKGSRGLVLLSDPLRRLLWTPATVAICQSCQWVSTRSVLVKNILKYAATLCKHTTHGRDHKIHIQTQTLTEPHTCHHRHKPRQKTRSSNSLPRPQTELQRDGDTKQLSVPLTPPLLPLTPCPCLPSPTWKEGVRGRKDEEKISEKKQTTPTSRSPFHCCYVR